jgi:hypothetical protein
LVSSNIVWNANNCDLYILKKDLSKPGISPYVLDVLNGDKPESTVDLIVTCMKKDNTNGELVALERQFKLYDYLSIPPPRTRQVQAIKERLVEQYPKEIGSVDVIQRITFKPFVDDGQEDQATEKASTDKWLKASQPHETIVDDQDYLDFRLVMLGQLEDEGDDVDDSDDEAAARVIKRAEPEKSFRWPCKYHQDS